MKRGGPIKRHGWLKRAGDQLKRKTIQRSTDQLRRGAQLDRGAQLRRRTRVKAVNPERAAARRAVQFGAQADLCRTLPCCACGLTGGSDPHHEPTRGAGGVDKDTVPLCRPCHDYRHDHGLAALELGAGIDVLAVAAELAKRVAG